METQQYQMICKNEFGRINRKLDNLEQTLNLTLNGNGTPGLKVRLDRLEQTRQKYNKLNWIVIAAAVSLLVSGVMQLTRG